MADIDARIVTDFVRGEEVPHIAARYGVTEDYVDTVVESATFEQPKQRRDWGVNPLGNRIVYAVAIAMLINLATSSWHGWIAGAVLLLLVSAIVSAGRR